MGYNIFVSLDIIMMITLIVLVYGNEIASALKTLFGYAVAVGYFLFFVPFALSLGAVLVPVCLLKQLCVAVYNTFAFGIDLLFLLETED